MAQRKNRSLTAAQWRTHINEHAASKQPLAAYCRQHGLAIATFRHWRHKLSETPLVTNPERDIKPATLVPVRVVPPVAPVIDPAILSVVLPNGARIEMRVTDKSFPWVLQHVSSLAC